jgi:hypothetical protein
MTEALQIEKDAAEFVGGKLWFTDGPLFSSTEILAKLGV